MLTQDQLVQFDTFGFIVLGGVLGQDELEAIEADFDTGLAIAERETARVGVQGQLNWSNLRPDTPVLASLLEDDRFLTAADQVLGERTVGSFSNSNSFSGKITKWHPDANEAHWHGIKFGFYLQPLDGDSGALRLIPGSHKDPLHTAINRIEMKETVDGGPDGRGLAVEDVPAYVARSKPGDVVLFDNHTWHGSYGGGEDRRLCTLGYFASPSSPEEEAAARRHAENEGGLKRRHPLLRRHDAWIANPDGNPVRQQWIDTLGRYGFLDEPEQEGSRVD